MIKNFKEFINENKTLENNYWKTTKSKSTFYIYAGSKGYECAQKDLGNGEFGLYIPKGANTEDKKDARQQLARIKLVAQAVKNEEEFRKLWQRIDGDWDYVEKNNLKGDSLISWAYNTPTSDEYDKMLRFN